MILGIIICGVDMRNMKLVDAVVALHEIARTVEEEIGNGGLSQMIRQCADKVHEYSIIDNKISVVAQDVINKAKE
jgi:hypothetical protein